MSSLVFLDPRDLIDCVEHQDPCDHLTLGARLRARGLSLVYTFSNILEAVPRKRPLEYAVELLWRLDYLPHVFIRHIDITRIEFAEAVTAFSEGREPVVFIPSEATFWRLLPRPSNDTDPYGPKVHQFLDGLSLAEQLEFAMMGGKSVDSTPPTAANSNASSKFNASNSVSPHQARRCFAGSCVGSYSTNASK